MKLAKMLKTCDVPNLNSGTRAIIYIASACDPQQDRLRTYAELRALTTLPSGVTLPTVQNALAERVTIGEPITFATGFGFTAYSIVITSGSYESATNGEAQFLGNENTVSFEIVGSQGETTGFADLIRNHPLVIVIGDNGGANDFKMFGSKDFPAFITEIKSNSGAKSSDKRSTTFKVSDMSGRPLLDYPLATLHPSGLPLATGN